MGVPAGLGGGAADMMGSKGMRHSDSSAFVPLQNNSSAVWNSGSPTWNQPYRDDVGTRSSAAESRESQGEFDPYHSTVPRTHTPIGGPRYEGLNYDGPMSEGPRYEGPRY